MDLQKKALHRAEMFLNENNLDNPNLTGEIWNIISGSNNQVVISEDKSHEFEENWSFDVIGKLQRYLVNYQLHQMKRDNPPMVFKKIKETFSKIESGLNILDIGCTTGYYSEVLNHYFPGKFVYEGCDYNKSSLGLAKEYYPDINFFYGDLTNLEDIKENSYDISFLSGVIEHVPKYEQGIKELCRITRSYIVLHRIWLTEEKTECKKGMQYYVPVIRNQYNKKQFFDFFDKRFKIFWTSDIYDGNCRTYILKNQIESIKVKNNTPVVIFHKGYKDYLKKNLLITSKFNEIFLLGDKSVEKLGKIKNVNFVNIEKYEKDPLILNLKKYFKNYSNYDFDWIWLAGNLRILCLYLFMKEYKFDKIFNTDSDNIIFKNIDTIKFDKDIAYSICQDYGNNNRMSCGLGNALLNINFCEKYIQLYKEIYVTGEKINLIKNKIEFHKDKKNGGGICEMTFAYLLHKYNYIEVQNLLSEFNNIVFMHHVHTAEGAVSLNQYEMVNGFIKLFKKNNKTMLYDKINKKYIEIVNIHFQGEAKKLLNLSWVKKNTSIL